jgi:hypothetical protein
MTILKNVQPFDGRHFETGPIRNVLAYQGVPAPHTDKPISEALLLGVSGGITVGYFTFEYKGYDPHIALLTRNTFDPMETMFERLAIPREVLQTSKPEAGVKNLVDVIETGHPALVWVDRFSLSYNQLPYDDHNWMVVPIVVVGVEGDSVSIVDRSNKPLIVPMDELTKARARVKDIKFRVIALDAPDMDKLPAAVQKGIWQCVSLYTDAPPKGKRDNFGFAALEYWADMLTNTRNKQSWERYFPAGSRMYAAVAGSVVQPGLWDWICTFGTGDGAERGVYADFLDEAAVILNKPELKAVGNQFRKSAEVWCDLANAVLPDSVPLLKETRDLKSKKRQLFIERGGDALYEIAAINQRLNEVKAAVADTFPMSQNEVVALRQDMRERVLKIHDMEREAVEAMQSAIL